MGGSNHSTDVPQRIAFAPQRLCIGTAVRGAQVAQQVKGSVYLLCVNGAAVERTEYAPADRRDDFCRRYTPFPGFLGDCQFTKRAAPSAKYVGNDASEQSSPGSVPHQEPGAVQENVLHGADRSASCVLCLVEFVSRVKQIERKGDIVSRYRAG
jgi:hypothetical protein